MNRVLLLVLTLLCSLAPAEGEEYTVYFRRGTDSAALVRMLAPLRTYDPRSECRYVVLADSAATLAEAVNSANALKAGVEELPSLVIADHRGAYAVLPLDGLNPERLKESRAAASAPDRSRLAEQRCFCAQQYLLMARMRFSDPLQGDSLSKCISTCRALMAHPLATVADRQRLGFQCLYPLLLKEYALLYKGAHTPASAAKLLEAIAALEAARDLNPNTTIGRKAFDERERLRRARRQARTME